MGSAATTRLVLVLLAALAGDAASGLTGRGSRADRRRCLVDAYPEHIAGTTPTGIRWRDGTTMDFDDARDKDHETRLNHPDLEDQLSQAYRPGRDYPNPAVDHDPGRIRYEPFFRKMYGGSRRAVRERLGRVVWLPGVRDETLRVSTVNGVDRQLQAVSDELARLPAHLRRYVEESAGTFVWRKVRGTDRLSAHSFGIAIDVGVAFADFWRWRKPDADGRLRYRNRIPLEVVEVFEKHGFIWGGKWYHFDTMHFEYRPELLHPACADRAPRP